MAEPTKKSAPKKKLGVYVQLTAQQRSALDEIGKKTLFKSDAAGDVLRIWINKNWDILIGKEDEPTEGELFPREG